ncbi:hypothetical protein DL765_007638 [Monosporascus sp. GIB2]|nr:hypothetical protein DL765_007638 [Monosporascus sp. GIB2]
MHTSTPLALFFGLPLALAAPNVRFEARDGANGISPEYLATAWPLYDPQNPNPNNYYPTRLYGFDKCDEKFGEYGGSTSIKRAFIDANRIVNIDGVRSNINWESAAALEFLGPSALNRDQRKQIQGVLANAATGDLDTTVAQASAPSNPKDRFNLEEYGLNQGAIMLHELLHLDVAADSVNETPNPRIHDLKVRFKYFKENRPPEPGRPGRIVLSSWYKAYGLRLAKVLARFTPRSRYATQTGYFVQRNVDNFVFFALSNYVAGIIGGYPWLPFVTASPHDQPMSPTAEDLAEPYINFNKEQEDGMTVFNRFDVTMNGSLPVESSEECPYSADGITVEGDLEIGPPAADDLYPHTYWRERKEFEKFVTDNEGLRDICRLAVREVWTCEDVAVNLYASLQFTSAGGVVLYETRGQPGVPINDGNPFHVQKEGMKHELKVVGQHTNDYVHFWYGDINWTSGTAEGEAFCKLVGDDWDKNGPRGCPNAMAIARDFDCEFPC